MANSGHGIGRLRRAVAYSLLGFRAAWRYEAAFREEVLASMVLLPAAFWIGRTALEWAIMIGTLLVMLITELFNSAIEALTDRVGTEHHELSGRAKDLASGAVLLAVILVVLVYGACAWQRFAGG